MNEDMIEDILGREYLLKNRAQLKAFLEEKGYPLSEGLESQRFYPEFITSYLKIGRDTPPRFWSALDDKERGF